MGTGAFRFRHMLTWLQNYGPAQGRKCMTPQLAGAAGVDLAMLRALIAQSPIRLAPMTLAARLAGWEHTRLAPDVDTVILEWIMSHVPVAARGLRHFDA